MWIWVRVDIYFTQDTHVDKKKGKFLTCRQKGLLHMGCACDVNVHLHFLSTMWINHCIYLSPAKQTHQVDSFFFFLRKIQIKRNNYFL